jgi:hypothetical protein
LFFPFLIPPFLGVRPEYCIWRARGKCFTELIDFVKYFEGNGFLKGSLSGQIEYSIYTNFWAKRAIIL